MTNIIYQVFYGQPLSKIIFLMTVLVFTWLKLEIWITARHGKKVLWKISNRWLCMGIIVVIFAITVSSRNTGMAQIQWIPLHFLKEAKQQPEIYRSMLMNVFLFFPLGLTMPHALPEKWKHNALLTIIFACILSIVIEYLQYHFHLGRAETDDVICNTLGCFIGTISYMISKKMVGKNLKIDHKHQ